MQAQEDLKSLKENFYVHFSRAVNRGLCAFTLLKYDSGMECNGGTSN